MKKLIAGLLIMMALPAFTQTGREVMDNVENQSDVSTVQSRMEMRLISSSGDVSTRLIDQYTRDFDGITKSMVIFQQPASVAGTRFLSVENDDRDNDQWIYLPSLRRVRRIAGSEGGDSFMGSEFSYDDISGRDPDDSTYEILGRPTLDGRPTIQVEMTPKPGVDSAYSKVISWVDSERWVPLKLEMYDDSGEIIKRLEASQVTEVQGIWTPIVLKMTNVQTGNATELEIKQLLYNRDVPDIFNTNFLQTGRQ